MKGEHRKMAGGFNLNALKNKGAGAGLLNEKSKELASQNQFKIINVPFDQIEKNPENGYHINDEEIQELMKSIRVFGLKQNLDILPLSDTRFRLVTGEKRFTALEGLHQNGEWGDTVPCTFTDLDRINLPLDDEDKEFFALRETNHHQRKYTDEDWLFEIERMEDIFNKLRAANIHEYEGTQIQGRKTRTIIAEKLGLKPTKTGWYQKINHKGTEELKQALADETIHASIASEVAGMMPEDQRELLNEVEASGKEKVEADDVKNFQKRKNKSIDTSIDEDKVHTFKIDGVVYEDQLGEYTITADGFDEDISGILANDGTITLNRKQYEKYNDFIGKLKKLLTEK